MPYLLVGLFAFILSVSVLRYQSPSLVLGYFQPISSITFLISFLFSSELLLCTQYYPIDIVSFFFLSSFLLIYISVCCSDWVVIILPSSRSLIYSYVSFNLIVIVYRLVFMTAFELYILFGSSLYFLVPCHNDLSF